MLRERAVAFRLTAMASDTVAIAATFLVIWLADHFLDLGRVFLQH